MLGPSGVTPSETRKSPNLQPVIGLHTAKAAQRSSPASPSSGPPRSTTRRMRFLCILHPLPSKEGGPRQRQSHRVTQQGHCSKQEVLGASPLWTIFVCHVAISGD